MEPWVSLMENLIVQSVWVFNATAAQNQCLSVKHTKLILVDTTAMKMALGKRVFIPEFTEMPKSFKL